MGNTQGLRKDSNPAINATNNAGARLASMISMPNMTLA